jgi:hypothetical protein
VLLWRRGLPYNNAELSCLGDGVLVFRRELYHFKGRNIPSVSDAHKEDIHEDPTRWAARPQWAAAFLMWKEWIANAENRDNICEYCERVSLFATPSNPLKNPVHKFTLFGR